MTKRNTPQDQTSADSPLYLVLEPEITSGAAQRTLGADADLKAHYWLDRACALTG